MRESRLRHRRRGRAKRLREEQEKSQQADERWGTDLMEIKVGEAKYFFVAFIDEYSRYLVHGDLLDRMAGLSTSIAAQAALETLPTDDQGELLVKPEIRSDNGSGYISGDFHGVLGHYGLVHHRITPHCPEENGIMERANRTFREKFEAYDLATRHAAQDRLGEIITWYNHDRLHSALGFLRPIDYYRGDPSKLHEARRLKLSQARHRRKQRILQIRQGTLPFEPPEDCPF